MQIWCQKGLGTKHNQYTLAGTKMQKYLGGELKWDNMFLPLINIYDWMYGKASFL